MAHIWKHMITHKSRKDNQCTYRRKRSININIPHIYIFLVRYCIFRPVKSMEKFGNHVALLCQKSHFHKLAMG